MDILYVLIGLVIGFFMGYMVFKNRYSSDIIRLNENNKILETERIRTQNDLNTERQSSIEFRTENAKLLTDYKNLDIRFSEQKKEIESLQKKFVTEFENLANKIFEEKSIKFSEQNRTKLDELLKPLGEKIKNFESRVNEVYVSESRERATLSEQLKNLQKLNLQMSEDANNLTKALKGDSKTQGVWGEFILEKILENSGLRKDSEYIVQTTFQGEEGKRQRPDVIINLPDKKHLVIDSKVSLKAYELFCSTNDDIAKQGFLLEHNISIKNHIKGLSQKSYQNLYGLESLDFVLMFVPLEPAFAIAVQNNPGLFDEAFEKNIVIVCPSTLLATLRTVYNIWRQEKQNLYALEIAKQSGVLYDKFVGFVENLERVGDKLKDAKDSYEDAMKKLSEGKDNLIAKAHKIKELGAKANKALNPILIEKAIEDAKVTDDRGLN